MKRVYLLLFLGQLLLISCNEKLYESKQAVNCYFQYEYVNYAWGFNHSGFTITPAGEVFSFDKTTPWVFAENNKISLSALKSNIGASVKRDTLISETEIEHYQQLAISAATGKLSNPISRGADMGEIICKIIVPDTSDLQGEYREVILTETGDFDQHNLSPEAPVIAAWIKQIGVH